MVIGIFNKNSLKDLKINYLLVKPKSYICILYNRKQITGIIEKHHVCKYNAYEFVDFKFC